jgi:ankyrin repeat protein
MEFFEAIKAGNAAEAMAMLDANAELAEAESGGVSAPMLALYYGHGELAAQLAAKKGSLSIWEAAALGDKRALQAAYRSRPDLIDAHSPDGFTALGFAAYFGRLEIVAALLDLGANPNVKSTNGLGVAPLHSALAGGQSAIALLLIEGGSDLNLPNAEGWTALHYCSDIGDAEMAELLLERGVDHSIKNNDGRTAAELATDVGHEHVAEAIFEAVNVE